MPIGQGKPHMGHRGYALPMQRVVQSGQKDTLTLGLVECLDVAIPVVYQTRRRVSQQILVGDWDIPPKARPEVLPEPSELTDVASFTHTWRRDHPPIGCQLLH